MLFSYVYLTAEVKRMQCDMGVVNMVAAPPMLNVFDGFPPFSLQCCGGNAFLANVLKCPSFG